MRCKRRLPAGDGGKTSTHAVPRKGTEMNFQNMEYFLAAAESGSITRAAEKLNITQQALSNITARTETKLGCRLYDRSHGLELNYSGKKYREAVLGMLDMQHQTLTMLNDINGHILGELRIGISFTRGQAILPLLLPDYIKTHPKVELTVMEGNSRELEQHLSQGDIDVMIGFAPFLFEGAAWKPLMKDRLFLIFPKTLLEDRFGSAEAAETVLCRYEQTHDIRLFRDLPFVLLSHGDRIRTIVDHLFSEAGIKPVIEFETTNTQTALAVAAEGVGVTVCPELYLNSRYLGFGSGDSYIRQKVETRLLAYDSVADTIAVCYNDNRYFSRAAQDFIRLCTEKFPTGSR